MNKKNLIIFIAISLMISSVHSACSTGDAARGKCCGGASSATAAVGVKTCGTNVDATDVPPSVCLQGYYLVGTGSAAVCTPCAAGTLAGTSSAGSSLTACTACTANSYCPAVTYGTTNVGPTACPTDSTSAASSDDLTDCTCTATGKIISTTTPSCETTTLTNCITFAVGTPDTCTLCQDGFRISNKVCVACSANCATCDSSGTVPAANSEKCLTASTGYYLNASKAPTACPTNSTRCTSGDGTTIVVTGVAANFYVQTGATNVATACTAGFSSLATAAGATATAVADNAAGCTIACSAGCVSCSTNGAAQCDVCQDEFNYDATTMLCTAITDTNRHPSCATARGLTAADCLTCRDADNRSLVKAQATDVTGTCTCQTTFTESGQPATATLAERSVCVACGKGVATCQTASDTTPLAPLTCTVATNLIVGNVCAASTDKIDGVYYDATEKQFLVCDTTCSTCANKGAGFCITCQDLPASTPAQTDEVTLLKAWTNGTLPATGGTCYSKCPTGYGIQDDTRVNCVMGSSSQIISMIAIFISFIYFI